MTAEELTRTISALFERLDNADANVFVHEGDMPFGMRGEKKRVKGCYLSKDAEGELCIVIEAETKKPQVVTKSCFVECSCTNCMLAQWCNKYENDYEFDGDHEEQAKRCLRFTPIKK